MVKNHGLTNYQRGCRCDDCRAAKHEEYVRRRERDPNKALEINRRANKRYRRRHPDLVRERSSKTNSKRTPTYTAWSAMRARCSYKPHVSYKYYGARGVSVCERWDSFENFLADMGERPEGKTLDRIDPDGNYEPGNCRWATFREQRLNQRNAFP